MSITKILTSKELSASDKLEKIATEITRVREGYGNVEAAIPETKVNTTHGMLPFSHLEDDAKIETLLNEALNIKAQAIAAVEDHPGLVLNKKVEELLATNTFFANASSDTPFELL